MEKILRTITRNRTLRGKKWRNYCEQLPETAHLGEKAWRNCREQLPETVHLGEKTMEKISRTITRNRTFRGKKHGENIANDYQKPYIKGKKHGENIANNYQKPYI